MNTVKTFAAIVPLGFLLAGCSTPAPVRDLASRGAATVSLAESAIRNYVATTNSNLDSRMNLLRTDAEKLEQERMRRELDHFYAEAAGEPSIDASAALIQRMAAKRKELRDKQQKELADIATENTLSDDAFAKVPTEKLAAAKKSFAVLSEELSGAEWITLIGKYAKVISDGMEPLINPSPPSPPPENKTGSQQ